MVHGRRRSGQHCKARRQEGLLWSLMPSSPTDSVFGGCMTLENIKVATVGLADTVSDSTKLVPEVMKLVQGMPDGVSGLLKQFRDRGLSNVASALSKKGGVRTITPEQI